MPEIATTGKPALVRALPRSIRIRCCLTGKYRRSRDRSGFLECLQPGGGACGLHDLEMVDAQHHCDHGPNIGLIVNDENAGHEKLRAGRHRPAAIPWADGDYRSDRTRAIPRRHEKSCNLGLILRNRQRIGGRKSPRTASVSRWQIGYMATWCGSDYDTSALRATRWRGTPVCARMKCRRLRSQYLSFDLAGFRAAIARWRCAVVGVSAVLFAWPFRLPAFPAHADIRPLSPAISPRLPSTT